MSLTRHSVITHVVWTCATGEVELRRVERIVGVGQDAFELVREEPSLKVGPLDTLDTLPESVASVVRLLHSPEAVAEACKKALEASAKAQEALDAEMERRLEAGTKKLGALEVQTVQLKKALSAVKAAQEEMQVEQEVLNRRAEAVTAERDQLAALKTSIRAERPELESLIAAAEKRNQPKKTLAKGRA